MNRLAKTFVLLVSLLGLATWGGNANAAARFSVASGNWNSTATWGTACGGAGGSSVPGTADTATICAGTTVAVNVATRVNALAIDAGATLNASTVQLRVNTTTSVSGAINFTGAVNAAHRFSGAVTINAGGAWTDTSSSTMSFRAGGITNNGGTFTGGTGVYEIRSANQTIGGSSPISIPSLLATTTITNTGTLTVGTALTGTTLVNSATATLNLGGTSAITTLTANAVGNTVNYTGAAQTVKATAYSNLGLGGSGVKTLTGVTTVGGNLIMSGSASATTAANLTIGGNLDVGAGTSLTVGAFNIGVTGTTSVSGTMNHSSATGTKTYTGAVTINALGSWTNTGNEAITYGGGLVNNGSFASGTAAQTFTNGGITHNGTVFNAGTGAFTFSTNPQAINCGTALTIPSISTAIALTNNCNLTVTTALAGAGNFINAANSQLHYNSTAAIGVTTLTASATGNLVDYGAAGNQTVDIAVASTYYHLTLSGSGAKAMGATTINGNFTMSGNATSTPTGALTVGGNFTVGTGTAFTAGNFNHTVAGNFDASGTFTAGTGTVTLNGATAQTISGTSPVAFNNLAVSAGSSPNITLAANVTVVTVSSGTVRLTPSCPDFTLTSATPAQTLHSCPTPPTTFDCIETGVAYTPNPVAPARNPLYTKLAGTAFGFDVVALRAGGAVDVSYASASDKSITVELVDETTGTGCADRTSVASQTLVFTKANHATEQGRKTAASMTVSKAYANLRCRVTDATQAPTIVGCSADNLSVRPGAATLTTTALAAAPSATATPVIKAGTAFTIGATTSTGATDAYTGTLVLDAAKLSAQLPSNGTTQQSGGAVGTLTMNPAVQANAAPAQSNNAAWNEVGYLYAAAGAFRDDGYTVVDQVGDCVSSTVGDANLADTFDASNKIGCSIGNKTAVSFGRFIPDHFDVATSSNGTMSAACASGSFTYTGQAMGYGTVPSLTIKAINAATGVVVTQNYQGVFQKLAAAGVNITAPTADGTQNGKDGLTRTALAATMSAGTLTNSSGTLTYTLAAGDTYTYTRDANSLVGAYTSNIPLVVAAVSDGEMSAAGTLPTLSPVGVSLRFGRLKLSNAYGSELLNLPVPIQTQYWNGTAFVTNTADNCTALVAGNIKLTAPPAGVSATVGGAFSSGKGLLILSKPTAAAKVYVDLCVDLGTDPVGGTVCSGTIANLPYLQGLWSPGSSYNNDPAARATFGVYKGNNEFIYLREAY